MVMMLVAACDGVVFVPVRGECPNYVGNYRKAQAEEYPWRDVKAESIDWGDLQVRAHWIPCFYLDDQKQLPSWLSDNPDTKPVTNCLVAYAEQPWGSDYSGPPRVTVETFWTNVRAEGE